MSSVSNASFHEFAVSKPIVNDSLDVLSKYASERHGGFAKALYVLGVDVPRALGLMSEDNKLGSAIKQNGTLFKLSRSPAMLFDSVNTTIRSTWSYLTGNPIANGSEKKAIVKPLAQVVRDAAGIVNPVFEMATFFTKAILFIPKDSIQVLGGVNGLAVAFLMGWNACESLVTLGKDRVSDLTNEDEIVARKSENIAALINLIKEVSFVVLGILCALSGLAGIPANPLTMTALTASGVVFTILDFYYKNIGQEKKLT